MAALFEPNADFDIACFRTDEAISAGYPAQKNPNAFTIANNTDKLVFINFNTTLDWLTDVKSNKDFSEQDLSFLLAKPIALSATLIHEYTHLLGYDHPDSADTQYSNSIPVQIELCTTKTIRQMYPVEFKKIYSK